MKKTLLTLMASLLLGGAAVAQHYTAPNAHSKSSNTPIVAAVTVDGAAAATGAELAVYVDDELRGLATTAQLVDGKFWVQVYYDTEKPSDTDPTTNVPNIEDLTFKLWDPTGEGTELTDYTLTYDNNGTTLTALTTQEEGWGTPGNPVVLDFATTQTQSMQLASGWNWWSTNIELEGINGLQQLENGLGTAGVKIKSRLDGSVDPINMGGSIMWLGTLSAIHNEQMYMIETNAASNVSITGQRASLSNHPITIVNGWNWIGYPGEQSIAIATALGGFTPSNGDKIKGRNGTADYLAAMNMWLGTLNNLEPGQGYMYMSNSNVDKTLVYQTNRQEASTIVNNNPIEMFFEPEIDNYAYNMTITAVVELGGNELRSEDYELAAFVGNECRGSVKLMYVEPLDRYIAFLLVYGDKEENLNFVLSDGKDAGWSNDSFAYSDNRVIGSLNEPAVLHFGSLGLDDNFHSAVNVYPNPSKDIFNVSGNNIRKVEIINVYGQIVYSEEVSIDNLQLNLRNYSAGTYLLRVVTDNGIVARRLVKE